MSKIKKVNLDTVEIATLIKSLRTFSTNVQKLPKEITKEVADTGLEYLQDLYGRTYYDETIDMSDLRCEVIETANGHSIVASSKEILYAEFGTGEEGADSPHPMKSEFDLNAYNSGQYVSRNINESGRHYWFYNNIYSEGNASGRQMFDTSEFLKKNVVKKVLKEKVGEVISKV